MKRLYLVVRADIPAGLQAAQAVHAAVGFAIRNHTDVTAWEMGENNVVVLGVPDEDVLLSLRERAEHGGYEHYGFNEPDLEGALTAIAFDDKAQHMLSQYPCALKGYERVWLSED